MNSDDLQTTLDSLRRELAQTPEVDESKRIMLQNMIEEIQRLGAPDLTPAAAGDASRKSLIQRMELAIEEFEARHPRLTAILSQLMDRLVEIGI